MTLRDSLKDWKDWDGAGWALGVALGLIPPGESWLKVKGLFWTTNPTANALFDVLDALVEGGVLERREEPDTQYRWHRAPDLWPPEVTTGSTSDPAPASA